MPVDAVGRSATARVHLFDVAAEVPATCAAGPRHRAGHHVAAERACIHQVSGPSKGVGTPSTW
jgi:hypothetical protein